MLLGAPGIVRADSQDDIKFSDDMWSPMFTNMLKTSLIHLNRDLDISVSPFPANSSSETSKEIELLLQYQETMRTQDRLNSAKMEETSFEKNIKFGLGNSVSSDIQKKLMKIIGEANNDLFYFLFQEKRKYKRARPTQLSSDLKAGISIPDHASYPSGHAAQSRIFSNIYGYVDPAQASEYTKRADGVALRREIFGLHYPSDSQAGKDLADQVFSAMIKVEAFKQNLDEVKRLYALGRPDTSSSSVSLLSDRDDIKYPEGRWNRDLLDFIKEGPQILSRDFDTKLPAPPTNTSEITVKELDILREYKKLRTPKEVKKIYAELIDDSSFNAFVAAGLYEVEKHPKTQAFMEATFADVGFFVTQAKKKFSRPRPVQLADDLDLFINVPHHASYPSGHSSLHYFAALVLSGLDPVHEAEYKQLAKDVARRREIAGFHYPSDSVAGRQLAQTLFDEFLKHEDIKALYESARDEY